MLAKYEHKDMKLTFSVVQKYWEKDEFGTVYHPKNRMPKGMAYRALRVTEPEPGVIQVSYVTRAKGMKGFDRFLFRVPKEVWACCILKWTGTDVGTLIKYVADYVEHPGKMESEMFEYGYRDWMKLMENDPDMADKVSEGRRRYRASLSSFDRYRFLYEGFDKDELEFDENDDVMCYACYHRATPTNLGSILGTCPMWMQMEYMMQRW